MSREEAQVLKALDDLGPLSWTDLLGAVGLASSTFKRVVVGLTQSGKIAKERNGVWDRI